MFIVFIFSLLYTPGWVLADVSVVHIGTGLLSLSITAIAVAGIYSQGKKVYFSLGLDSFAMIAVFILGNYFIYTFG